MLTWAPYEPWPQQEEVGRGLAEPLISRQYLSAAPGTETSAGYSHRNLMWRRASAFGGLAWKSIMWKEGIGALSSSGGGGRGGA